jgi:hypothetical protein
MFFSYLLLYLLLCRDGKVILNGATSIWADHLTLALPAFAAARLLTGGADLCSLTYIALGNEYRYGSFFFPFLLTEDRLRRELRYLASLMQRIDADSDLSFYFDAIMPTRTGNRPTFNTR